MSKSTNKHFVTLGIYAFLFYTTIILLYPVLFGGEGSFCIIGDNLHLGYPFLNKLSSSLHKGYLPVWDANTFGGKNFVGEFQSGTFYPLNILWCLLFGSVKGIDAYYIDLLVSLHYFICLTGMYSLARTFQLSQQAAVGSGLIFTFTGIVSQRSGCEVHIFYGLALLPWVIYFVAKYYWVQRQKKYLIFAGLLAGGQILAGHIQPFFHTLFISAILILFYEYRSRKNWGRFLLAAGINIGIILLLAIIIALPQIYYAAEYLSRCYREVGGSEGNIYIGPSQKVPLFVYLYRFILTPANFENLLGQKSVLLNDFNFVYMGILPFFLCIVFLIKSKYLKLTQEHRNLKKTLMIILLIGIVSVLGYLTFFPYVLYVLPFVNGIRELSRYVILISFSDALLAGLALTYLLPIGEQFFRRISKQTLVIISLLALNALYWILFQQENIPLDVSIPFLLCFLFFLLLMTARSRPWFPAVAIVVILFDLLLNPVNYGARRSIFYPDRFYARNRIVDFLESTYGKYRVSFDMQTYALTRRNLGDVYTIQTKFGYGGTVNQSYFDFIYDNKNPEIDDLLNIKYVITDKLLDSNFIFRDSIQHLNLYERRNFYPRCYWQHQLGRPGAEIEIENKDHIRQLAYSDLYQQWAIDCAATDTLIFSENCYPGWKCYDNQKEVQIVPATIRNYPRLFRSVALGKGHHNLEFKYNKVFYWF